jgi:hypothetical protein
MADPSGYDARGKYYNQVIRGAVGDGNLPIIHLIELDLDDATKRAETLERNEGVDSPKALRARGRITGIAQVLTFVKSPFTREDKLGKESPEWLRMIKKEMEESRLRLRAQSRDTL